MNQFPLINILSRRYSKVKVNHRCHDTGDKLKKLLRCQSFCTIADKNRDIFEGGIGPRIFFCVLFLDLVVETTEFFFLLKEKIKVLSVGYREGFFVIFS
jgi:hypothetical protein